MNDIQFNAAETIMYTMSSTQLHKWDVTNPAVPTGFQAVWTWPQSTSNLFYPNELVMARDENFMLILGASSTVGVYVFNSTVGAFAGWFYANGMNY